MYKQKGSLEKLLGLLDKQYKCIMNKDVFSLDKLVLELDSCSKEIAQIEIQRRNILKEESIKEVVKSSNDEHLDKAYKNIKNSLQLIQLQKETNDTLIKQELFYTNKMINLIKPNNNLKTYNSYGQIKK
jgi:flagellar biosynthesis/type III secretory pathway chaperone